MSSRGMFRNAQKGIKAKQLDAEGNEVSFDVREDEEMVRCGVLPILKPSMVQGYEMNTASRCCAVMLVCTHRGCFALK